jgi:Carbohydrate esterase, sialic acid-specific acetylesterase
MPNPYILAALALAGGSVLGALVQRFYPAGKFLHRFGLRGLIPIARNMPEPGPNHTPPEWDVPEQDRGMLTLLVLMGQSNMSGRGTLASPGAPQPHGNIYEFNKDYRWCPAREPLGTRPHEVDWVATDGGTGVGPGLAFARALLERDPTLRIGLIQCARGASTIEDWQPSLSQNSLYGACLKRICAASSYGVVEAVLFSQGESDADDPRLYPGRILSPVDWGAKFGVIVEALRRELGRPELPVIYAQLGKYAGTASMPGWDTVRQQQAAVKLPGVTMIRTEDFPLQPDGHFSTESNVELGRRFAIAYLNSVKAKTHGDWIAQVV